MLEVSGTSRDLAARCRKYGRFLILHFKTLGDAMLLTRNGSEHQVVVASLEHKPEPR